MVAVAKPVRCYACDSIAQGTRSIFGIATRMPACRRHADEVPSAPEVQALGAHADSGESCTITLDVAKALGIGHSMRALAHSAKMPEDTKALYLEVGTQLVSAARAEMAQRIAKAAESARKVRP